MTRRLNIQPTRIERTNKKDQSLGAASRRGFLASTDPNSLSTIAGKPAPTS